MFKRMLITAVGLLGVTVNAHADNIIADDQIIQGSQCVGFDCADGTSFGFDAIRVDENNTRMLFNDTSSSSSFPTRNWQLRANESTDGGLEYFGIIDMGDTGTSTGGTRLFSLEAGAPANSLYIDSNGKLGLGTAAPIQDIHPVSGDTPTLRLDQDNSQGWGAQIWDVAANETNFFIRDVTNGSLLPFRIRPGAPTSSIDIAANGNVGVGVVSPSSPIHVKRSDGSAKVLVEEASGTTSARQLYTLQNNGPIGFGMVNTNTTDEWRFAAQTTGFRVSLGGSGGPEFEVEKDGSVRAGGGSSFVMNLDGSTGDMTIDGTLTEGSSRAFKTAIDSIDPSVILGKLAELPLAEWSYKKGDMSRHLGPMAEDFYKVFGLGPDAQHIAPKDLAGVAMASAKALHSETRQLRAELEERDKRIEKLERKAERVDELETRLERLEARMMANARE